MEKHTDSTKSEGGKTVVVKKWYWWIGLMMLILMTGFPYAIFKSLLYLIEGSPRRSVVVLLEVPLNWIQLIFVTIPETIVTNPSVGIGMVIGLIGIPTFCIWLMKKGRKMIDKSND